MGILKEYSTTISLPPNVSSLTKTKLFILILPPLALLRSMYLKMEIVQAMSMLQLSSVRSEERSPARTAAPERSLVPHLQQSSMTARTQQERYLQEFIAWSNLVQTSTNP